MKLVYLSSPQWLDAGIVHSAARGEGSGRTGSESAVLQGEIAPRDPGAQSSMENGEGLSEAEGADDSTLPLLLAPVLPAAPAFPAAAMPAMSVDGEDPLSAGELAAMAAAVEEAPERPGMFMAAIGEGVSRLQSLPFFLPSPAEHAANAPGSAPGNTTDDDGLLAHSGDEPDVAFTDRNATSRPLDLFDKILEEISGGPVVYRANERYTVERDGQGNEIFRSVVARGDTAGVILNEWLPAGDVTSLIAAVEPIYSLKNIVVGRPFILTRKADGGEFVSFCYESGNSERIVVTRGEPGFLVEKQAIEFDVQLVRVEGVINANLFDAVSDSGEGPALAVKMADVFSCEVNFINEIRRGDSFLVVVEKLYRDGEFKGYGNMLGAYFTNQGKTYEAYLFPDENGRLRHYNNNGEALQKMFLKAPLSFTRVSSGYSMNRRHPVFGYSRPHQGVDYAAPHGTPIMSVADGVVTRLGWGNGYGNMVVVRHANGLQTQYAHMSGFVRGLKRGSSVRQGQIIGYVGATGVATGPHLDFRIMQNSRFIDPTRMIVPRLAPVDKKRMPQFLDMMALAKSYLDEETALAEYQPVAWDN